MPGRYDYAQFDPRSIPGGKTEVEHVRDVIEAKDVLGYDFFMFYDTSDGTQRVLIFKNRTQKP